MGGQFTRFPPKRGGNRKKRFFMKSKIKIFGIIVLTAVIVPVMIACGDQEKDVDTSKYYLDPPTGVTATVLSTSELHLTWNAVPGAGYYEIRVRTNLDSADTRLSVNTTSNTSYTHGYYSWYWGYYSRPEEVTTLYYFAIHKSTLFLIINTIFSVPL